MNPGDRAPDIDQVTARDGHFSLDDERGKVVLVHFWATWCGPCVTELPVLQTLYGDLKDEGLSIVGIAVDDDPSEVRRFLIRNHIEFPVVLDGESKLKRKFRVTGMPESFLIDRDGKIAMFPDPENGIPVVRVVGPRVWTTPVARKLMRDQLSG